MCNGANLAVDEADNGYSDGVPEHLHAEEEEVSHGDH